MLTAIRRGWFPWNPTFEIREGEDSVGKVGSRLGGPGRVVAGSTEYSVACQGRFGPFLLQGPTGTVAQAERASTRSYRLTYGGRELTLRCAAWSWRFVLVEGEAEIGAVDFGGRLASHLSADLPEDMPLEVRLFVLWLILS